MIVPVKLIDGKPYIDKTLVDRFGEDAILRYDYTAVYIDDRFADCISSDFNNELIFDVERYNSRKQKERYNQYEGEVVFQIRQRYSLDQELAILRQRDTKPAEFYEYNTYVEKCKADAKAKFNL